MKTLPALGLGAITLLAACQQTGAIRDDQELPSIEGKQIRYTPEGCDYDVTTPEVEHALAGGTGVGPEPFVDHVHASWAGPSHSTFAVNWRTDNLTLGTQLLYGTDRAAVEAAEEEGGSVRLQRGHTMRYASFIDLGSVDREDAEAMARVGTRVHEAHVCGLDPSTTYYYKVGNPGHWSQVYDVSTGPAPGTKEPFRFAVSGDSRNRVNIWAAVQKAILDAGADFQIHSGDAVNIGPIQEQWDQFFEATSGGVAAQDVLARVPFMMANGNHDILAINYLAQFAFPQEESEGESSEGMEWYHLDYGNARLLFLNDTTANDTIITRYQRNWLRENLRSLDREKTPWVFVVHHKPTYSCGSTHGSDTSLRAAWQPVFDEFKVDVVFNGHVHNYERSRPIRGFQEGSNAGVVAASGERGVPVLVDGEPSGTVYVVSAGAGAPLYGSGTDCYHTQVGESVEHYAIVDIEDRTLWFRAYRLNGSIIDEFTITK